jgi:hypothetical protein
MEGDFYEYYINDLYTTHAVVCWVTTIPYSCIRTWSNFGSTSFSERWLLIPELEVKGQAEPLNCIIVQSSSKFILAHNTILYKPF